MSLTRIDIWLQGNMETPNSYEITFKNENCNSLKAISNYKLHLPVDVPEKSFWSWILYDAETYSMIDNQVKIYAISSAKGALECNEDGSTDIYFGPDKPQGKDGNWIPTTDNDLFVGLRFYAPDFDRLGIECSCNRPQFIKK